MRGSWCPLMWSVPLVALSRYKLDLLRTSTDIDTRSSRRANENVKVFSTDRAHVAANARGRKRGLHAAAPRNMEPQASDQCAGYANATDPDADRQGLCLMRRMAMCITGVGKFLSLMAKLSRKKIEKICASVRVSRLMRPSRTRLTLLLWKGRQAGEPSCRRPGARVPRPGWQYRVFGDVQLLPGRYL